MESDDGDLNQERFNSYSALLNNGQVLIAGGQDKKIPSDSGVIPLLM